MKWGRKVRRSGIAKVGEAGAQLGEAEAKYYEKWERKGRRSGRAKLGEAGVQM